MSADLAGAARLSDIQQNQRIRALRGFISMHHQALAARGELPVNAFQLVAILPGADVFRNAVIGQRALSRRVLAFAGADGEGSGLHGIGQNRDVLRRAPHGTAEGKQAETIRNRQQRNADGKNADMRAANSFSLSVVPKSRVESQKSLCLPPGQFDFQRNRRDDCGQAETHAQMKAARAAARRLSALDALLHTAGKSRQTDAEQ